MSVKSAQNRNRKGKEERRGETMREAGSDTQLMAGEPDKILGDLSKQMKGDT